MPQRPRKLPPRKKETNWVGLFFGWLYIIAAVAIIYHLVEKTPPQNRLVCSRSSFTRSSLIQFGLCRDE